MNISKSSFFPDYLFHDISISYLFPENKLPGKPSSVRTRTLPDSIILSWDPPDDNILVRGYMVGYGEGVPDVNWQYVDEDTRTFAIRNLS